MPHSPISLELTHPIIRKWLLARQGLLSTFHDLCQLRPFNAPHIQTLLKPALKAFCQSLVDYLSLLHFQVLEHLAEDLEAREADTGLNHRLLELIWETSESALSFNQLYEKIAYLSSLESDLAVLSEKIAQRLTLEDKLLDNYLQAAAGKPVKVVAPLVYAKSA